MTSTKASVHFWLELDTLWQETAQQAAIIYTNKSIPTASYILARNEIKIYKTGRGRQICICHERKVIIGNDGKHRRSNYILIHRSCADGTYILYIYLNTSSRDAIATHRWAWGNWFPIIKILWTSASDSSKSQIDDVLHSALICGLVHFLVLVYMQR